MTTCIPIIFKPIVYNGDNYVDGGLSGNFPIEYNRKLKSKNYLGINISVVGNGEIKNILDYIYHIYISPWSPYDNSNRKNKNVINIIVNDVGIIFTNQNDKKKKILKMVIIQQLHILTIINVIIQSRRRMKIKQISTIVRN